MTLKEFTKTNVFEVADKVEYYNDETCEKLSFPSSKKERDKFYNREVISHGTMVMNGIAILEVYLK